MMVKNHILPSDYFIILFFLREHTYEKRINNISRDALDLGLVWERYMTWSHTDLQNQYFASGILCLHESLLLLW